jgi:hypothetical protein
MFGGRVDKRYSFVDAIEKYRSVLQDEDKAAARKIAGKTFYEDELRQFMVIEFNYSSCRTPSRPPSLMNHNAQVLSEDN